MLQILPRETNKTSTPKIAPSLKIVYITPADTQKYIVAKTSADTQTSITAKTSANNKKSTTTKTTTATQIVPDKKI